MKLTSQKAMFAFFPQRGRPTQPVCHARKGLIAAEDLVFTEHWLTV
jgi:hypothetical protein